MPTTTQWDEKLKGLVRPYITVSGWSAAIVAALLENWEAAKWIGAMTAPFVAWWFRDRVKGE